MHLLSTGAGMALLAGCSGSNNDENGENGDDATDESDDSAGESDESVGDLPPYASVLRETDQPDYFYGAIGFETMNSLSDGGDADGGDEPSDPLLGNPILVAFLCSFGFTQLAESKSAGPFTANNETDGDETLLFVEGVYAFSGSYAFDGLTSDLEEAGYTGETVEETHAVYSDPDSDEVVGVSDTVFSFSYANDDPDFEPIEAVEHTVATAAGEREAKYETDEEFESLLRAGETDDITLCLYTSEDEFDAETISDDQPEADADQLTYEFEPFAGATGVHQRLSLTGADGSARATAVVAYSTDSRVDQDLLESTLGTDADSVSVDRDGTTVTVDADYDAETVDE